MIDPKYLRDLAMFTDGNMNLADALRGAADRIAELELEAHTKDAFYGERIAELEAENARLREAAQDFLDSTREAGPEGWRSRATKRLEKLLEAGDDS